MRHISRSQQIGFRARFFSSIDPIRAGVVRYDVDFAARKVTYHGCNGEEYIEDYRAVDVD
jgi:uncharacterized protein YbcV (DUF1398 family)